MKKTNLFTLTLALLLMSSPPADLFAIIVLDIQSLHLETILSTLVITMLLCVLLLGLHDNTFGNWLNNK